MKPWLEKCTTASSSLLCGRKKAKFTISCQFDSWVWYLQFIKSWTCQTIKETFKSSSAFHSVCFTVVFVTNCWKNQNSKWSRVAKSGSVWIRTQLFWGMLLHFLLVLPIPSFKICDFCPSTGVLINYIKDSHILCHVIAKSEWSKKYSHGKCRNSICFRFLFSICT